MSTSPRYAIYYVPPAESSLYRFGAEVIGYDSFRGADLSFPAVATDTAADWQDITADPRKYGFHATLKAPFALASGTAEADLIDAFSGFAHQKRTIPEITPVVDAISGFVAIVPAERSPALDALAQHCVEAFDPFRAALSDTDRARRNPEALTSRQVEQLDRWGYPYVKQDFRFHMTLTGRIADIRRDAIVAMLRERFTNLELATLAIDHIALLRQNDATSRFTVIRQHALVH